MKYLNKKLKNISLVIACVTAIFITQTQGIQAQQGVTISAPISSTVCTGGSPCTINWASQEDRFEIRYLINGSSGGIIEQDYNTTSSTNFHSYSWAVPNDFDGSDYSIKITEITGQDQDQNYIYDDFASSANFTINRGPYISITSPSSGIYTNGSDITVSYTTNQSPITVKLKKLADNSLTTITPDGNNKWTIPSGQAEGDYRIQLSGGSVTEESATFTIEPKRITVTYPYDNLIFEQGAKPVIRWSANYAVSTFNIWVEDEDNSWTISSSTSGDNFEWNIPSDFHLDNDFEVYVKDNSSSVTGIQSGKFTIEKPNPEAFTLNSAKSTSIKTPINTVSQIAGLSINDKAQSIGYVDGTGKTRQSIVIKSTPNQKDVISTHVYNEIGQKDEEHQPFVSTSSNGIYINFALEKQKEYYCYTGSCIAQGADVTPNSHPYSRVIKEKSPLQTVKEQGAPGADWQPGTGNTITSDHRANVQGEVIIHWTVDANGDPKANGLYDASLIAISKTVDENGKESYVYTDREGREILKKGFADATTPVQTYYVYDQYNNLRFIIPPEAVDEIGTNYTITLTSSNSTRTTWLTEMQYDGYQRVIWKKIPEAEPVYTVYDKLGRVALTQDGNMRVNNEWFFTKYDIRGRAIMTGTYTETDASKQSRVNMQAHLNSWPGATWESRTSTNYAQQHGYTFQTFPDSLAESTIWSVTYYDDYDFDNNGTPDESFVANSEFTALTGNNRSAHEADVVRTDGMVTGSKTRILKPQQVFQSDNGEYGDGHPTEADVVYYIGTSNTNYSITLKPGFQTKPGQEVFIGSSDIAVPSQVMDANTNGEWLDGVTFYDKYGRTIYTKSTNHLGGEDKSWTLYHFDGEVERTKQTHTVNSVTTTIKTRFEYDHNGRLLKQYHQTNGGTEQLVTENSYNELGQLITKELNKTLVNTSMVATQTLDYSYHLRGWLESVNDPSSLGSDLFAYKLYYEDQPTVAQSLGQHNGNIIAMEWANDLNGTTSRNIYSYEYDGLNQLTQAKLNDWNNTSSSWQTIIVPFATAYSYDLNGNMKTLRRNGKRATSGYPENLDNLSYSYSGNQITSIADSYNDDPAGFIDGANTATEYAYDLNGSMTRDDNKGITDIRYNKMNLPEVITFSNGNEIVYLYDAAGTKLSKTTYPNGGSGVRTDYVNGFVYTDSTLDFFAFSEGRVRMSGTTGTYEYDMTDHLGNVRATFTSGYYNSATLLQADSYYPFGLKMPGLSYVASGADENKFTYNGKELEDEFGLDWYHYGVRFYDPTIGRWWAIDPAEEFHSPYVYVGNATLRFVDPDGAETDCPNGCYVGIEITAFGSAAKGFGSGGLGLFISDEGLFLTFTAGAGTALGGDYKPSGSISADLTLWGSGKLPDFLDTNKEGFLLVTSPGPTARTPSGVPIPTTVYGKATLPEDVAQAILENPLNLDLNKIHSNLDFSVGAGAGKSKGPMVFVGGEGTTTLIKISWESFKFSGGPNTSNSIVTGNNSEGFAPPLSTSVTIPLSQELLNINHD